MPEIMVRPAMENDIPILLSLEHDYTSDYAWQMDIKQEEGEEVNVQFRQIRLPRAVKVEYPRQFRNLKEDWKNRSGLLVANFQDIVIGYINLVIGSAPDIVWATDLAVKQSYRRQGVASALVLAGQTWTRRHGRGQMVLEMQSKNYAAISLARKLGYDFCGYNDRYYSNRDIVIFFAKAVR